MLKSFVLYRLPKERNIHFINEAEVRSVSSIDELVEAAFVISPFDDKAEKQTISYKLSLSRIISEDEVLRLPVQAPNQKTVPVTVTKEKHIHLLDKMITRIRNHDLDKGVLSRVKQVKRQDESITGVFLQLCQSYPTAFVYLASLPDGDLWCGATPETLAIYQNNMFRTMALAGTQAVNNRNIDEIVWEAKEKQEQIWVQDHISNIFNEAGITYQKSDTYTAAAGHLVHLKNDFTAHSTPQQAKALIAKLQPTPAVCGTPTLAAKKTILKLEEHQREYYSGYLGILSSQEIQLFVNLRCMKIYSDHFYLYVGGGITADSDAVSEWLETENKAQTLESVLKNRDKR